MKSQPQQQYEFGPFRLDTSEHSLLRDGQVVPLEPKVFNLLRVLVENDGRLLQKEELLKVVWPDSFVEEGNLNRNISILRKALGEDSSGKPYIETVPKRGYRFVANVKKIVGNGSGSIDTEAIQDLQLKDADQLQAGTERAYRPRKTLSARRWLVLGGLLVVGLGTLLYALARRHTTDATRPEIKSLAVLPLQNLSGDSTQEYFADGMTEALISSLAQIRALRVISRTSVMSFKGTQKPLPPLPEIARQLRVDGVIGGSVQRENGRVKVMIQLIHGPTDTHLWARDYERELTDVLKLQGEMARAIADEIRIQVTLEEGARLASAPTVNPAAHEAYLLGRYHLWKYIVDDQKRAIGHFERAIRIDSNHARAYAGLSMAWQMWGAQGQAMKGGEAQARAAVQKALELDDQLAEAYVARGHLQFLYDWDWRGGENSIKRALELDPNNLDAHFNYAILLLALGRFPEALTEIQSAQQLDPLSHQVQSIFGKILLDAGRRDEAILRLTQAIDREPRSAQAHHYLGEAYEQMGRHAEALAIYDKARVLRGNRPDNPPFLALRARVYARMGKRSEARRILAGLGQGGITRDFSARAYTALGDTDEAFRLLFRKVEKRDGTFGFIKTDPQFASLHSDPRWRELLRRMNFPQE
ncbi:MAG: tetratricopeptide repeat protein [Acidobacteria bacterium]|nr:tetratricopeptide repeat protein [Acidobacteriota bacterium]